MIKIKQENPEIITLVKGNKKIKRPFTDYKSNQRMWEIRGFKPEQDVVKEENVSNLQEAIRKIAKAKKVFLNGKRIKWTKTSNIRKIYNHVSIDL